MEGTSLIGTCQPNVTLIENRPAFSLNGIRAIFPAKRSFQGVARPFSTRRCDLHFPGVSECASTNCRGKPRPYSALQKRGGCHGFNYHQRRVVSVLCRLFPRCKRTKRLSLAGSRNHAAKNQGVWISRKPKVCRLQRFKSGVAFQ